MPYWGRLERFLSVFIEHTEVMVSSFGGSRTGLTINDTVLEYVDKITTVLSDITLMKPVRCNDVRFTIDSVK